MTVHACARRASYMLVLLHCGLANCEYSGQCMQELSNQIASCTLCILKHLPVLQAARALSCTYTQLPIKHDMQQANGSNTAGDTGIQTKYAYSTKQVDMLLQGHADWRAVRLTSPALISASITNALD